jgi:hypothetical protein
MDLNFTFNAPKCLFFLEGKRAWKYSSATDIDIIVKENDISPKSYDVNICLNDGHPEPEIIFSYNQFRISEHSSHRIVLHNWTIDDCSAPEIFYEFVINLIDNKLFSCTLVLHEKREEYIFLNESECRNDIYIWSFNSYNHIKNGVFTERLMNGFYEEWTYVNNIKHGQWKSYHKRGHLEQMGYYYYGRLEGEHLSYFSDGKVHMITNFRNGKRNGKVSCYNKEGVLEIEGYYLNDKRVGKWIYFDHKGEFDRFEDYGDKGKPLFFKELSGAGIFTCRDCGYSQKITVFLHGLSDKNGKMFSVSGYQCQNCGMFYTRKLNSDPQSGESMICSCGGDIKNDSPLYCPKCKSKDVEYGATFRT